MSKSIVFSSNDVPQADSLDTIRILIKAIKEFGSSLDTLEEVTDFSYRHLRYRIQAARILGFLDDRCHVTASGRKLISHSRGSRKETDLFKSAIRKTLVVKALVPDLFELENVPVSQISKDLARQTGLSKATADRRARVLRSWARQLRR